MLTVADRIVLVDGIRVTGAMIEDPVREARAPLNETGAFVVTRLDRSLGTIARELSTRYGIGLDRATCDVLAFAWHLNRTLFANVVPGEGRVARARGRLLLLLRLLPAGRLPHARAQRHSLDTRSTFRAITSAARGVARRGLLLASLAAALAFDASLAAGTPGAAPLLIGVAVGSSLVVHECGHAAALRGIPAALVVSGPRTFVLHPVLPSVRAAFVAAAGPALAVGTGVIIVLAGMATEAAALGLSGLVYVAHAVGLTVATREGRRACAA